MQRVISEESTTKTMSVILFGGFRVVDTIRLNGNIIKICFSFDYKRTQMCGLVSFPNCNWTFVSFGAAAAAVAVCM